MAQKEVRGTGGPKDVSGFLLLRERCLGNLLWHTVPFGSEQESEVRPTMDERELSPLEEPTVTLMLWIFPQFADDRS